MSNAFERIVEDLDLVAAVRRGSQRNDLLPPRLEDNVLGEVGKRFSESLRTKLQRGRYDPTPAEIVLVPKPGNTTRPAALLTLSDRVVFDAIVELLRPRIEASLLGRDMVLWPRGVDTDKRWDQFESSPLTDGVKYVALADVTGFYESIDHERLREVLVAMTGKGEHVNALVEFLGRIGRGARGIPQGLAASDPIATAYLSQVDSAMARAGIDYSRHGDDVRMGVQSEGEAREALYLFEQELRRVGLLVNGSKAIVMGRIAYERSIRRSNEVDQRAREELMAARIAEVQADSGKLGELLEEVGEEQLGWNLFYHGSMSVHDVIDAIKHHLRPDDMAVAMRVLNEALAAFSANTLTREEFHFRVSTALIRLAAGRSPLAIEIVGDLLARFPEKAELVSSYLAAQKATHGRAVVRAVVRILTAARFRTDWEHAWLLGVLRRFSGILTASEIAVVRRISLDEDLSPFCRVEAVKTLAKCGEISKSLVRRLWSTAQFAFSPIWWQPFITREQSIRGASHSCLAQQRIR